MSVRRWGTALVASTAAFVVITPTATAQAVAGPSVSAKGAFLLDSKPNRTLWSKSADTKRQMASTTKIMTAVVVLETRGVDLDKRLTVKQSYRDYVAGSGGGSTADLKTGDKLSVRQLLYGLLVPSGCDAAYALADAFGTGSTEAARTTSFISKMNKKAADLGMTNTKYDSFDGISRAGNNVTTPRDLAKLARRAIGNSTFGSVVKSISTRQVASNGRVYTWHNTNNLLDSYNGAIGIKTGTGSVAGRCLVFAAKRGDRTVVGVVLNDPQRYTDARKMLDWAFNTRTSMKLRTLPAGAQQD
ncbi:D-alanyl-D-alanine carboxypeptidase family protein [Streptomyces hypolithicus]